MNNPKTKTSKEERYRGLLSEAVVVLLSEAEFKGTWMGENNLTIFAKKIQEAIRD